MEQGVNGARRKGNKGRVVRSQESGDRSQETGGFLLIN